MGLDEGGKPVDPLGGPRAKATVLLFLATDCPISNRYAPTLNRLYRAYSPQGVRFWLVYPDPRTSTAAIRSHKNEYGYRMRALRDPGHRLVREADVTVTPEAAVFAPGGKRVYHGRVDDRFVSFGQARPAPTENDLANALNAVLKGKPVARSSVPAVGCYIQESS